MFMAVHGLDRGSGGGGGGGVERRFPPSQLRQRHTISSPRHIFCIESEESDIWR